MKAQIDPAIKAHLVRGAFYLIVFVGTYAIPFALAQRNVAKQSAGQPRQLAPSAAGSALTSKSTVPDSSVKAPDAASSALVVTPGKRSLQIRKSPRHISGNIKGVLWYNGDFNGVNGLANEKNTLLATANSPVFMTISTCPPADGLWEQSSPTIWRIPLLSARPGKFGRASPKAPAAR